MNKVDSTISEVTKAYYSRYKAYGDLNTSFDGAKITEMVGMQLAVLGISFDAAAVRAAVNQYIDSRKYKRSSTDDLFFYLVAAGLVGVIIFIVRKKKK